MEKILNFWDSVTADVENNTIKTEVYGRTYTAGDNSFLESVISQNTELLAEPVRILTEENGILSEFSGWRNFLMNNNTAEQSTVCSSAESDAFVINTTVTTYFDGVAKIGLSVMPQGRSVKAAFGLEKNRDVGRVMEKLILEVPLKKEVAKFYQFFPNSAVEIDGKKTDESFVNQAGDVAKSMRLPFKEQMYLANDNVGFAVFFESDKNFYPVDRDNCIEVQETDSAVILRYKLFDSEPKKWHDKGFWNGLDLTPICFNLGFAATPLKPFDSEKYYSEHAVHIDCFKKIAEDYEEFLQKDHNGEVMFDRLKRLGVNTLYLHEKWNDLQNSPHITKNSANRLRYIVKEAHLRGIRVIPYFGFEISSLSPYFAALAEEIRYVEPDCDTTWYWYRQPPQRDLVVCYNSQWCDVFADGVKKLMDEFKFDGLYLDGTIWPRGCANEKHGCGYRDYDGKLHKTYPIWQVRSLMRRLYETVTARGGTMNCHGAGAFNITAMSFCTSLWEGEMIQGALMNGEMDAVPEGHLRSVFCMQNLGIPTYMLCYSNPPVWTFDNAVAQALVCGILPKPVDCEKPLETTSEIWRLCDSFGVADSVWHPYFANNNLATASDENVKVSYYEKAHNGKNARLVIVANTDKTQKKDVKITFADGEYTVCDGINLSADGVFDFDGISYKIFITE